MTATIQWRNLRLSLLWLALLALAVWVIPARAQQGADPQLEQGAQLYLENCAPCHGENGEGRVGATLAQDWPSIRPDLRVRETIASGVPGSPMPAWGAVYGGPLSDAQIDALVAYILSWQTGGYIPLTPFPTTAPYPPITPAPGVEGDPSRGAVLYAANCDMCHGASGEGRIGAVLAKDWPSIRPDLSIQSTITNGVDGSPMPAWGAAQGGPLSDTDINDLVAYILSWSVVSAPSPTPTPAPVGGGLGGWGILVTLALFGLAVAVILLAQRKRLD